MVTILRPLACSQSSSVIGRSDPRCAAHHMAQHYGLQTMVVENTAHRIGSLIIVRRAPESRFPLILLSDTPMKQFRNDKAGQIKIFVPSRLGKSSSVIDWSPETRAYCGLEERKEEYDKSWACIIRGSFAPGAVAAGRNTPSSGDEKETGRNKKVEAQKISTKETSSKVAIFRDREKDRIDNV